MNLQFAEVPSPFPGHACDGPEGVPPERERRSRGRKNGFPYLLSGIMSCAQCGEPYFGAPRGQNKPGYHHAWCVNEGVPQDRRDVLKAGGCRCFTFDAEAVH